MFKLYISAIKTSVILLLFSLVAMSSIAATFEFGNKAKQSFILLSDSLLSKEFQFTQDTLQDKPATDLILTDKETEFTVPLPWSNETFEFQVNSQIIYFTFDHFMTVGSKKLFLQALMKEKELSQLTKLTDSLRQEYIHARDDRKSDISGLILNNEKQSILLNQDIPELYQNARKPEAEYWQNASSETIAGFQEIIKLYRDNIKRKSELEELTKPDSEPKADTLVLYIPTAKIKEVPAATTSGITYKIQIAAFKSKLPDSAEKAIKKLSLLRKVETYTDEKGVKIYTTGNLKTWAEAITLQKQVKQEGIRNPSIAAYENNVRIPANDARRKNNEL